MHVHALWSPRLAALPAAESEYGRGRMTVDILSPRLAVQAILYGATQAEDPSPPAGRSRWDIEEYR